MGRQLLELPHLRGVTKNPLGHPHPHPEFREVEGFAEEVIHAGVGCRRLVFRRRVPGRKEDEINVVRRVAGPHAAAEFQPVDPRHHPITHHDPHALTLQQLPCRLAGIGDDDFVAETPQGGLQHRPRNGVVFYGENLQTSSSVRLRNQSAQRRISRSGSLGASRSAEDALELRRIRDRRPAREILADVGGGAAADGLKGSDPWRARGQPSLAFAAVRRRHRP